MRSSFSDGLVGPGRILTLNAGMRISGFVQTCVLTGMHSDQATWIRRESPDDHGSAPMFAVSSRFWSMT